MKLLAMIMRLWVLLLFGLLCGYIALYNGGNITLYFHTLRSMLEPEPFTMPIYQAFSLAFLLGAVVTTIYFFSEYTKKSFEVRRLRRELEDAKKESYGGSARNYSSPSSPKLSGTSTPATSEVSP